METTKLTKVESTKHADLLYDEATKSGIVQSTDHFIPFQSFKTIFEKVEELMKAKSVSKLIFDKRTLNVFDQASMEWYYLEWKVQMLNKYGLKDHIKILPEEQFFRKSVDIGRNKILDNNKDHQIQEISIRYIDTLEEALQA